MIGSVRGIGRRAHDERRSARRGRRRRLPRATSRCGVVPDARSGRNTFLFTHLHVREDAMMLYGFPSRDERDTFEALIGATGVGPKLALAILSVHTPNTLRRGLADDDLDALMLVPGVGKRTAQRLLVDLKARLEVPDLDLAEAPGGRVDAARRGARRARRPRLLARGGPRPCSASSAEDGTVEDLLARRAARRSLAGGVTMREELLSPTADPAEVGRGDDAAAAPARRVRRPAPPARAPRDHAHRVASSAGRPSTTCCSRARPAWARPRWPASSPPRWARACSPRAGPRSSGPATSPRSSPTSTTAACCSSTRSTACRARSKRSSIRRWRTSSSTS